VVLALTSILASLLLFEIGLRAYAGLIYPKMMIFDPLLGWRHSPNVRRAFVNEFGEKVWVVQNSYGHRGPLRTREHTPETFRIVALGYSFTEGVQVDESDLFTAQLERTDSRFQVLNAGVGGYGTVQEYLYLASEGLKFEPNVVLLMFYENDLTDNALTYYPGFGPRPYATFQHSNFVIVETLNASDYEKFIIPVPFRMVLNNHSFLYYFVNSRIYQPLLSRRMKQLEQADLHKTEVSTRYEIFYRVLDKMYGLVKDHGIGLVVVLIPTAEQVARGYSEAATVIRQYCDAHGMHCLSLLESFRHHPASGDPLYFPIDIHWTKEGHKVAAEEIRNYLSSLEPE